MKDNRIYLKKDQCLAIPFNKQLKTHILKEYHDIEIAGYLEIDKTIEATTRFYYWPKMKKDIKKYIQTYNTCQRNKPSNQYSAGLLQPLTTPTNHWKEITMDFVI